MTKLRTFAAVLFGALLVSSLAIGGPGVESAAAEWEICSVGMMQVVTYDAFDIYDCQPETDADKLQQADAEETEKEIYDQASIQKQNSDHTLNAYGNYLSDTQSIALMEGKNAYIRALENGSSESVARNRATEAVADYYATKQKNLIAGWNITVVTMNSSRHTAENTSGVNARYVTLEADSGEDGGSHVNESFPTNNTRSVTLVNSSSTGIMQVMVAYNSVNFDSPTYEPADFLDPFAQHGSTENTELKYLYVKPPNSNYDRVTVVRVSDYQDKWDRIETQNDQVQAELDTFINNTYDSYQQGEINSSDLVDPYLGAREYSPENSSGFQSWTLRTLSSLGLNSPENLSNMGRMNVTYNGVTYTGILMSDENPEGGFTVGETYNATKLNGSQFVALDSGGSQPLEGNFTLKSAETADGVTIEKNESITYNQISYETTNTSEFKELQSQLDNLTASINERQQVLRSGGGSGGFDLTQNQMILVAVLGLGVAAKVASDGAR